MLRLTSKNCKWHVINEVGCENVFHPKSLGTFIANNKGQVMSNRCLLFFFIDSMLWSREIGGLLKNPESCQQFGRGCPKSLFGIIVA